MEKQTTKLNSINLINLQIQSDEVVQVHNPVSKTPGARHF
jgi:hypothetical protein